MTPIGITKTHQGQSPGIVAVVKNLDEAIQQHGLKDNQFAAMMGWSKFTVSRLLSGERDLSASELKRAGELLGCTPNQLLGMEPRIPSIGWQPVFQEPKKLLDVMAEHQSGRREIIGFDRNVVCSATTEKVHEKRDGRLFKPQSLTESGRSMLKRFGEFARKRREGYLTTNEQNAPRIVSVMFKEDFELLVSGGGAYEDCNTGEIVECLDYLANECVDKRRFRLLLVERQVVENDPELLFTAEVDSFIVVGRTLVVERGKDFSITFSADPQVVAEGLNRLRRLMRLAGHDLDDEVPKAQVLKELAACRLRGATKKINEG